MALRASTSKGSGVRELLFAIVLAVIFFEAGLHAPHKQAIPTASGLSKTAEALPLQRSSSSSQNDVLVDHPIPKLMADAEDKFRSLLARQSKTFEDAVAEYQRRYKRDPPKGFDDWYKFAVEKNVKLIDEFDAITEDLNPFWALSGEELRRRVDQVCQRFFFSFFLRLQCSYMKYSPLEELEHLGLSRSFLQRVWTQISRSSCLRWHCLLLMLSLHFSFRLYFPSSQICACIMHEVLLAANLTSFLLVLALDQFCFLILRSDLCRRFSHFNPGIYQEMD